MTETYRWRGGTEMLLRHGAGSTITILVLPALFEEANRMRRFTVSIMRGLADRGIGTILPDMPGTGESETTLCDVMLEDWHEAILALAPNMFASVAIRGGALLDGSFANRWRLAPDSGERLLRDMVRATAFSDGVPASQLDKDVRSGPTRLAGNLIGPAFYLSLHNAVPVGGGYVTPVDGPKLWRAAEPGDDQDFVHLIVEDIASWAKPCGA